MEVETNGPLEDDFPVRTGWLSTSMISEWEFFLLFQKSGLPRSPDVLLSFNRRIDRYRLPLDPPTGSV